MPKPKRRLTIAALSVVAGLLLLPAARPGGDELRQPAEKRPDQPGACDEAGPCTIVSFIHPSDPERRPLLRRRPGRRRDHQIQDLRQRRRRTGAGHLPRGQHQPAEPERPDTALATADEHRPDGDDPARRRPGNADPEFGGRLPVKKGQHLAIDVTKSIQTIYNSNGSKFSYMFTPPLVDGARPPRLDRSDRTSCSSRRRSSPTPTATASATRPRTSARARRRRRARATRPRRWSRA